VEGDVDAARVASLGEELLRLLRIGGIRLHLGIVAKGLWLHRGRHGPPETRHELLDDRLLVDGVVGGLTHRLLVEGRHAHVELDGVHAQDGRGGDVGLRVRLQLGHEVCGDVADDVHATRLGLRHLRRHLGDGAEDQLTEGRLAAPVLVEGLQPDELIPLPLHELPGSCPHGSRGAEGLVAHRFHVLPGHDAEEGETLEEEREGFVGGDHDGLGIDHADVLDGPDVPVLRRLLLGVEHPIERILHVFGGHDVAVVEAHPLADLELPLRVRHRLPRGGEGRLELELGVPVQERVEHVHVDENPDPLEVHVRIEGGRMRDEGDDERVLPLGMA